MHPHGILSISHQITCTNCSGYMDTFTKLSGNKKRNLFASVVFYIPLLRDLLLWWV